jgi:hypothetical protein
MLQSGVEVWPIQSRIMKCDIFHPCSHWSISCITDFLLFLTHSNSDIPIQLRSCHHCRATSASVKEGPWPSNLTQRTTCTQECKLSNPWPNLAISTCRAEEKGGATEEDAMAAPAGPGWQPQIPTMERTLRLQRGWPRWRWRPHPVRMRSSV